MVLQTGQSGVAASAKAGEKRQSGNAGEPPSKRLKADIMSMGVPPSKMVSRYQNSHAENANPNQVVSVMTTLQKSGQITLKNQPIHLITKVNPGNCPFRCFSYLITGSENYHFEIRSRLIEHMPNIPNVFTDTSVHSVDQYLRQSRMDRSRTWGTDKEVMALSHLLNTTIYTYTTTSGDWGEAVQTRLTLVCTVRYQSSQCTSETRV